MEEQTRNTRDMKAVYTVVERGQGKSFWVRVGIGFTNKDGSLNLHLDAIPTNGKLQVREWEAERRPESMDARPRPRPQLSPPPVSASDPLL
ncbi:MAG TPA: hypothetical protein VIF15_19815 [Polyangiaceae bacterium]|jgi:hypothetical protein